MKNGDHGPQELSLPDGSVLRIDGRVIVQADRVEVVEEKEQRQALAVYRRNAILLSGLVFLAGLWFHRHMQSVVAQYLIGIPALVAAWQVASSTAGTDLGDDMKALRKKFIGSPRMTRFLIGGYVASAVALLFTASIIVELGSGEVKEATVQIVDARNRLLKPPIHVDAKNPVDGRIFFPRFFTDEVQLVAKEPEDYISRRRTSIGFRPMSAERINFATDFEKKHHRVVVVVPGLSVRDPLASSPSAMLTIEPRGRPPIAIKDFEESTVVTGVASSTTLAAIFNRFDQQEFPPWLSRELAYSGVTAANLEAWVGTARKARFENGHELREGDVVTIRLRLQNGEEGCRAVALESEVTPVLLEMKPC